MLGGAIAFFVFVYDRLELGSPTRIRVYFASSGGIREHAALVVGGRVIGHVEAIETAPHGEDNPLGGAVGSVAIVAIDDGEAWKVPADAEVFVSSRGLLSERFLEVAPPRAGGTPTSVREGAKLRGIDPPSLDTVLRRTWTNMTTFRVFTEQVGPELASLRAELGALGDQLSTIAADVELLVPMVSGVGPLLAETRGLVAEARTTYDVALGGPDGIAALAAVTAKARATIAQLRAAIDLLAPLAQRLEGDVARIGDHVARTDPPARVREALAQLRAALDRIDPLVATIDDLAGRMARHEGSLGRLMYDPEFPEDAKELGKILKRHPWRVIAKPKD